MTDTDLLAEAETMTPANPGVRNCWYMIVSGLRAGWLGEHELTQLVEHLGDGRDYGVRELHFAHLGDDLRVCFLTDEVRCAPELLRAHLERLLSVRQPPPPSRAAESIKRAFDQHFASYRLALPPECLTRSAGAFEQNGWDVQYRFGTEDGLDFLELFATHRMTNDRLYRVWADGCVEMVDSSMDGMNAAHDRRFYDDIRRRGYV